MSKLIRNSNSGVSFSGLLTLLFIALKLTGFINWSWWWVLFPVWSSAIILLCIVIVMGLINIFVKK